MFGDDETFFRPGKAAAHRTKVWGKMPAVGRSWRYVGFTCSLALFVVAYCCARSDGDACDRHLHFLLAHHISSCVFPSSPFLSSTSTSVLLSTLSSPQSRPSTDTRVKRKQPRVTLELSQTLLAPKALRRLPSYHEPSRSPQHLSKLLRRR